MSTACVLSAPAVWGRATMELLPRLALFAGVRLFPDMTLTGRGLQIKASDNVPMLQALARDPMVLKGARIDTVYGLVDLMDDALAAAPRLRCRCCCCTAPTTQLVPRRGDGGIRRPAAARRRRPRRLAYYPKGYHLLLRDLDGDERRRRRQAGCSINARRCHHGPIAQNARPTGRRVASGANLTLETERLRRELTPKLTIAAVGWGGSPCPEETLPTRTRNDEVGGKRAFAQPIRGGSAEPLSRPALYRDAGHATPRFHAVLAVAAGYPHLAGAQQKAMPVIGLLSPFTPVH